MMSELEELSVKLAVLAQSGELSMFECDSCKEQGKDVKRNCICQKSDDAVFYHPLIGELAACPIRYIPDAIIEFLDRYRYYMAFPSSAPRYEDVNPRFWEAFKLYQSFEVTVKSYIYSNGTKKDPDSAKKAMSSLRRRHLGK